MNNIFKPNSEIILDIPIKELRKMGINSDLLDYIKKGNRPKVANVNNNALNSFLKGKNYILLYCKIEGINNYFFCSKSNVLLDE